MQYRRLGRSGLLVSSLTFGTMAFGGQGMFGKVGFTDLDGAKCQIDMCLDAGINLFDTVNMYSDGQSEEILGQAVSDKRDDLLLATKVRMPVGEGPNDADLSRHHTICQCEESLKRLGTDRIDLYQVHEWDGLTPLEKTLESLDTLVKSGKTRYVGSSNYSGWQQMKTLCVSERHGFEQCVSQQIHYTLQAREAEYELVPLAVDQGAPSWCGAPLAGGLLSGKYQRDADTHEGRYLEGWDEPPVYNQEKLYDTVDVHLRDRPKSRCIGLPKWLSRG